MLEKIWYFRGCEENFLADVADRMVPGMFNQRERIRSKGQLWVIERGLVVKEGRLLSRHGLWGEDLICGADDQEDFALALTYVATLTLTLDSLEAALVPFPALSDRMHKAGRRIVALRRFRRAVRQVVSGNKTGTSVAVARPSEGGQGQVGVEDGAQGTMEPLALSLPESQETNNLAGGGGGPGGTG